MNFYNEYCNNFKTKNRVDAKPGFESSPKQYSDSLNSDYLSSNWNWKFQEQTCWLLFWNYMFFSVKHKQSVEFEVFNEMWLRQVSKPVSTLTFSLFEIKELDMICTQHFLFVYGHNNDEVGGKYDNGTYSTSKIP